jgi:hypothetical protein
VSAVHPAGVTLPVGLEHPGDGAEVSGRLLRRNADHGKPEVLADSGQDEHARDADERLAAMVAAGLASLTFSQTVAAWGDPDNTEDFGVIAGRVLRRLHAVAAELK